MRLGKKEYEILEAISVGDELFGLLTSGGSGYLAHKQARRRAHNRAVRREKYLTKKRLENLAKKNLITLEPNGNGYRVSMSARGGHVLQERLLVQTAHKPSGVWDGSWRVVMFDIPQEHAKYRHALRHLLCRSGYVQVQQSVYVYPYRIPGLFAYLASHQVYGGYLHIFEGKYEGDDTRLRKKFNLTSH